MEMGVPGLAPVQIGVEAEIAALRQGVAAIYPDIFGIRSKKDRPVANLFLTLRLS
jgi:hypothetical protein